jgi:hypothetical protein
MSDLDDMFKGMKHNLSDEEKDDVIKKFMMSNKAKLHIEMTGVGYNAEIEGSHKAIVHMLTLLMQQKKAFREMVEDSVKYLNALDKQTKEN